MCFCTCLRVYVFICVCTRGMARTGLAFDVLDVLRAPSLERLLELFQGTLPLLRAIENTLRLRQTPTAADPAR